jgi:hypothetical protein
MYISLGNKGDTQRFPFRPRYAGDSRRLIAERSSQSPPLYDNGKAIAFFQNKIKNALTDPAEIAKAEAELAAFQKQLNQNRIELGDRPILPE